MDRPEVTRGEYDLPFPVVSDPSATWVESFHVVNRVDGAQLAKLHSFGIDLESYSGERHNVIAIPSLFLIDRGGVVRWAHADPDFKVRPSTAQILAAIDALAPLR